MISNPRNQIRKIIAIEGKIIVASKFNTNIIGKENDNKSKIMKITINEDVAISPFNQIVITRIFNKHD